MGKLDDVLVTTDDIESLKVSLKKSHSFLATNAMKLEDLTDSKEEITTSFDFDREDSIEGGFDVLGEKPNILNIAIEFIDGTKESFSINIEDKLSLEE